MHTKNNSCISLHLYFYAFTMCLLSKTCLNVTILTSFIISNSHHSDSFSQGYEKPKAPEFTSKLQQAEPLQEGRPYHIECKVSAQPMPTVSWYKNGRPIDHQPRYRTSFMKGVACLDIQNPVPEDAGVYECVASNPAGVARTEVMVPGQSHNLLNT